MNINDVLNKISIEKIEAEYARKSLNSNITNEELKKVVRAASESDALSLEKLVKEFMACIERGYIKENEELYKEAVLRAYNDFWKPENINSHIYLSGIINKENKLQAFIESAQETILCGSFAELEDIVN